MLLNFLFSVSGILFTPYVLARTGSETAYGVIQSLFNGGMLAGSIIIGIWGGTRPRIHTIMPAAIIMSVLLAGLGMVRTIPTLAVVSFFVLLAERLCQCVVYVDATGEGCAGCAGAGVRGHQPACHADNALIFLAGGASSRPDF